MTHRHTNVWVDVETRNDFLRQEGNVQIPRGYDSAGFCINFVDIILRGCDKDVLNAVVECVDKRLVEDLLGSSLVIARQFGSPKLIE